MCMYKETACSCACIFTQQDSAAQLGRFTILSWVWNKPAMAPSNRSNAERRNEAFVRLDVAIYLRVFVS